MPNNYFQFKQFTVQQEKAALKVSTDSCLFGAWVAAHLAANLPQPSTILDIGTGTGLLMLMLAQKLEAKIDGIEIDESAYQQATANVQQSPWKDRLHTYHADVRHTAMDKAYDFIISNPPFYEGDVKSGEASKNLAKHDTGLTLEALITVVDSCLSPGGSFSVLLPFHRTEAFFTYAKARQFYCSHWLRVKQTPAHSYFRSVLIFSRVEKECKQEELIIREANNQYSAAFISLLKEYYLYL